MRRDWDVWFGIASQWTPFWEIDTAATDARVGDARAAEAGAGDAAGGSGK